MPITGMVVSSARKRHHCPGANADGTRALKLNQDERGGLITIMDRFGKGVGTVGVTPDHVIEVMPTPARR